MSVSTSKEMFINMRSIPDSSSSEYDAFFENEKLKIENGVTINGFHIGGWLYWHLNHWHINVDTESGKRITTNPSLRDNELFYDEMYDKAKAARKGLMLFGTRRFAKDLLNSSKLYQKDKEITIGECKVGDKIYGDDGKLTTILEVCPQGKVPIYEITLRDNRKIYCGLYHNWYVFDKHKQKYVVKTTEQLIKGYSYKRIHNGYKDGVQRNITEERYFIPNNNPVEYEYKDLEIDPYFLGLWLGDGSKKGVNITTLDKEVSDYIYKYAKILNLKVYVDCKKTYMISTGIKGSRKNILLNLFRKHNLINNKHIPNKYLYSAVEQRLELLRGIMDTDGSCTKKTGSISLTLKDNKLADDVYKLCRSLGISLTRTYEDSFCYVKGIKKYCGKVNRFSLYTELDIFKLGRKLKYIQKGNKGKQAKINKTAIVNIKYVYDDYSTCILVDNNSHLFLTDDYTVTHNSEILASHIGRYATMYDNSENIIAGGSTDDLIIVTSKVDLGLNMVHPYFKMIRIKSNWNKEVVLGFKDKQKRNYEWSKILIRNFEEGNNPKVLEGITPMSLVLDEIGKYRFLEAFQAAIPSFNTPFGWRCVPICTGTGGQFIPNSDAEKLYKNPDSQNFLSMELPNMKKKRGIFIPGTYRMDAKDKTLLGDYIQRKSGILIPADSELNEIPFEESNPKRALEIINEEIEQYKQSDEPKLALKHRMYFPIYADDCFLNEEVNNFPLEAIEKQITYLQEKYKDGEGLQYVRFYRDVDGAVKKSFDTNLVPITEFPVSRNSFKDAPVVIYEDRMSASPSYNLYIAGADTYDVSQSANSPSLGVIYIYKRMYDPIGGTFQDMIVASYAARPEEMKTWNETVEMLIEYYGAVCMFEATNMAFTNWFDQRNIIHYLADGYNALKEIAPTTSVTGRVKGLPAIVKVQTHYMNLEYQYTKEKLLIGTNPTTKEPLYKLGVSRIPDIMLLREMLSYSKDGNFDRIVAFGHALAYDAYLQKFSPVVKVEAEEKQESFRKPNFEIKSPFILGKRISPF